MKSNATQKTLPSYDPLNCTGANHYESISQEPCTITILSNEHVTVGKILNPSNLETSIVIESGASLTTTEIDANIKILSGVTGNEFYFDDPLGASLLHLDENQNVVVETLGNNGEYAVEM